MTQSMYSFLYRIGFNFFPPFRRTGAKATYISSDFKEMRIKLPLNFRTKNIVGTIYGGSIYSSIDPCYMFMLMKTLGKDYIVWDKAASIRFIKPGRTTLYATFKLNEEELSFIRKSLETKEKIDRIYEVKLVDQKGDVHAKIDKTLHIRRKDTFR